MRQSRFFLGVFAEMKQEKYIPGIDGLRAVAVLLVLFFHVGFSAFSGGYVGVDVFFVISGFLITRLIVEEYRGTGSFDFGRFYYRRARRLFPAMFATFIVALALAVMLFTPQHLRRFGGEAVYAIFSISNFFFLSESGYFNTSSDFKPLLHTWSLSVEEQFYLAWPALMIFALKLGGRVCAVFLMVLMFLGSLALSFSFSDGESILTLPFGGAVAEWLSDGAATIYFFTPMRVFEFCIGGALVFLSRPNISPWFYEAFLFIGILLISYSVFAFDGATLFPSYNALFPCLGAALIIFSCHASPVSGAIMRSKPMVFVGLISYSVYLVHWPLIVFTKYWLMRDLAVSDKILLCVTSIILGYFLYRVIETPFRHAKTPERKAEFALACVSFAVIALLPASAIWFSDGWKWRIAPMPPQIAQQLADSKQFHVDQYGGAGYPYLGWVNPKSDGKADIILLGDSHAMHYAKGIDELVAKPLNKSIYISSVSCLMLPRMTRITHGHDWDSLCEFHLGQGLKVIKESPKDSIIVMSHYWHSQLENAGVVGEGRLKAGNSEDGYRFISGKVREFLEVVGDRRVVVIGNVPGPGFKDIAGCFARPKFININCDEKTSFSHELLKGRLGNEVLKKELSVIPNVTYLDPADVLCENGQCKSVVGGSVLYSDENHLSKAGSMVVVKGLYEAILGG
ncbi:O-acetyltransferase OatA [compost metagenome]